MITVPVSPAEFEQLLKRASIAWNSPVHWVQVFPGDAPSRVVLTPQAEFVRIGPFQFFRDGESVRYFSAPDHQIMHAWADRQRQDLLALPVPADLDLDLPGYVTYLGTAPDDLVYTGPYNNPALNRLLEYILKMNSERPDGWVRVRMDAVVSLVSQQASKYPRSSAPAV